MTHTSSTHVHLRLWAETNMFSYRVHLSHNAQALSPRSKRGNRFWSIQVAHPFLPLLLPTLAQLWSSPSVTSLNPRNHPTADSHPPTPPSLNPSPRWTPSWLRPLPPPSAQGDGEGGERGEVPVVVVSFPVVSFFLLSAHFHFGKSQKQTEQLLTLCTGEKYQCVLFLFFLLLCFDRRRRWWGFQTDGTSAFRCCTAIFMARWLSNYVTPLLNCLLSGGAVVQDTRRDAQTALAGH